jgi:hypothetical protein
MAQQSFAGLAVLDVLAFTLMALSACVSSEQAGPQSLLSATAPSADVGTSEFHGAALGEDALRSRLGAEGV